VKVLIDTNVILDVLLKREEFFTDSQQVLSLARHGIVQGALCATTITTIDYLATRALGQSAGSRAIRVLLDEYEIAPVDGLVLRRALGYEFDDFEDAVIHAAAVEIDSDAIVTRDQAGFARATLPVLTPTEAVIAIRSGL